MAPVWRRCNACGKDIACRAKHFVCSVSTCNRARSGMVFCSVECWDTHLPIARHREAWAEERTAPDQPDDPAPRPEPREAAAPQRRVVPAVRRDPSLPREVLVVTSKLKAYVKAAGGLSTSDAVAEVLSDKLRDWCDRAIERAKADGRKTVLDRDFG